MTANALHTARAEAVWFVALVRKLEARMDAKSGDYFTASKEGGAVRRASMDLTRALAELRGRRT